MPSELVCILHEMKFHLPTSLSLTFLFLDILSDAATFSWSGLLLTSLDLDRPSGCLLLVRTSFSPWHFSLNFFFWWCHFLSIPFALVISESWQPLLLTALESRTWHALLSWQTSFSSDKPGILTLFLSTSPSLDTAFAWFSNFCWYVFLFKIMFLWGLLSWHLLCLEVVFHSQVFLFASLSLDIFVLC